MTSDEPADDVRYLDLDRDGVPDAVEHVRTAAFDTTGDGRGDVIETSRETEAAIDIEGTAHHVEARRELRVEAGTPKPRRSITERLRRANRVDGLAAVRVRPRLVREGLERLCACGERLPDVQVSLTGDRLALSSPEPSAAWVATYSVAARLKRGAPADVVVSTDELAQALQRAETVHARGIPMIARPPHLWLGDNELRGSEEPPTRPSLDPGAPRIVARGVIVPRPRTPDGESAFVFRRGTITTSNSLLYALEAAAIAKVDVVERAGRIFLEGRSSRRRSGRLTVTGQALLRYS